MRIDIDTTINKNQFARYIGRCRQTASKYYKGYLVLVHKKDFESLTVGDLAKLDDLTPETVVLRLGIG